YAGSKFVLEFQINGDGRPGGYPSRFRKRVPYFLGIDELREVQRVQNEVIRSLRQPPTGLLRDPSLRIWYLGKFEPVRTPYTASDDVWFRYASERDVARWVALLQPVLERVLPELEQRAGEPPNTG